MGAVCGRSRFPGERFFSSLCPPSRMVLVMPEPASVVFVVDDDPSLSRAIQRLVESVGLQVELFGSAQEFLQTKRPDVTSCLVLDIRSPKISGLELQRQLADSNIHIPVIFITAHGDIPMTVRAMKAGAVEF